MRLVIGLTALTLLLTACSSSDNKAAPENTLPDAAADSDSSTSADTNASPDSPTLVDSSPDSDSASSSETTLAACPDEVDLRKISLPCDCYGHEANATTIVDPNCKTQVVCCPSISNLRCEDHEYLDDAGNWLDAPPEAAEAAVDADASQKCPDEVDLSTTTLPCDCYGTFVTDPKVSMPSCTKKVVCCPGDQGLKCE